MPHISLYDVGDTVVIHGPPRMVAIIKAKTTSSVTVDVHNQSNGKRELTQWSPQTIVRLYLPSETPPEAPSQPSVPQPLTKPQSQPQTAPQKPVAKTEKPVVKAEPKPKASLDVFGVRVGTMASAVNAYLLKVRKSITVEMVLANVEGSKKDNVKSHLKRMVKDGLLLCKDDLIVSVPKAVK